jgi:pyruvate dehydrogenase (quinone)
LAALLNAGQKISLLCGGGCAGAHDQLLDLAARLKSPIVHALRGKEHVEWENPFDVGMTGLIGFASGYAAMEACDTLLMLGTDFPYRQFYPAKAKIAQVDIRGEVIGRRAAVDLGVIGDVGATIGALLPHLHARQDMAHLETSVAHYKQARAALDTQASGDGRRLHPQQVTDTASRLAAADAIFTCDVGLPTVWAARHLQMNGKRRLIGSFWHGSMANAMAQAIGAQAAFPGRQVVSLSGDGGFTMLMGDLLSLKQLNLPVKVIVFNNGALGFIELEQKSSGFVDTGTDLDNPDFAAMANAVGIKGVRITAPSEVESKLAEAFAYPGPVVIDAVINRMELAMPPKITGEMAKGFTLYMMKAVMNGRADEVMELAATNLLR